MVKHNLIQNFGSCTYRRYFVSVPNLEPDMKQSQDRAVSYLAYTYRPIPLRPSHFITIVVS